MKRDITLIMVLSVFGAVISFILLYLHFFPHNDFGTALCGSVLANPCAIISQSGFSSLFGFPIAWYGLIVYSTIFIISCIALVSGESYYLPCFSILLPVFIVSIIADVIMGSVLIYLGIACRLCILTYVINILLAVILFVWYMALNDEARSLRVIYLKLFSFLRSAANRPMILATSLLMVFMVMFFVALSAYMNSTGTKAVDSQKRVKDFEEYYFSLLREDASIPESRMSLGPSGAEIRIVAFTDFFCSACARLYDAEKAILAKFFGKIRIDYYSFPLDRTCNMHVPRTVYPNSCVASQAFIAASRKGFFKEFLEYHYEHYRENLNQLKSGDALVPIRNFYTAKKSQEEFNIFLKEMLSETIKKSLNDDVTLGAALKVKAVPTLFINGRRLEGIPDTDLLVHIIQKEMKKEK